MLHGSTPERFRAHLRDALDRVAALPHDEQLVFVKSWNEWAEGNHLEPDLRERLLASAQSGLGDGPGIPGEHDSTPHGGLGNLGSRGDGREHHPVERALAHLARDEVAQVVLLVGRQPGEQVCHRLLPDGGGPGAGHRGKGRQRLVDLCDRGGRGVGWVGE